MNQKKQTFGNIGVLNFKNILENMIEGCQIIGFDWKYIYLNPVAELQSKLKPKALIGKCFTDMWPGVENTELYARLKKCMETRDYDHMISQFYYPDETIGFFELKFQPIQEGVLITSIDITKQKLAENQLIESEKRFRSMIEGAPDPVFIQHNLKFVYLNQPACELFGVKSKDELIGTPVNDRFRPNSHNFIKEQTTHSEPGNQLTGQMQEQCLLKVDGTEVWVEATGEPIIYDEKDAVLFFVRDISRRKQVEKELKENEERWQFALTGANHGVWDWNLETNEIVFSEYWKSQLGYEPYEVGDSFDEWEKRVHPDDLAKALKDINNHINGETPYYESEHRLRCKDGSYKWMLDRGKIFTKDKRGKPVRMVGTHTDITSLKQMKSDLLENERLLREAQELAGTGSYVFNFRTGFWKSSETLDKIFGIGKDYVRSVEGWRTIVHPDWRQSMTDYLNNEVSELRRNFNKIYKIKRVSDNEERWVHGVGHIELDKDGILFKMIGTIQDITDRKLAEDELVKNRRILQLFIEHAPAAIAMFDTKMNHIAVSNRFKKDYHVESIDIIGRNHYEIFPWITKRWREIHNECLNGATRKSDDESFQRNDGHIDWVRWEIRPWYEDEGEIGGIILFSELITTQKLMKDALEESEARFRMLAEHAPIGVIIGDKEEKAVYLNRYFSELTGYNFDDVSSISLWWNIAYPDITLREEVQQKWAKAIELARQGKKVPLMEYPVRCKDGSTRQIDFRLAVTEENYFIILTDVTERDTANKALRSIEWMLAQKTITGEPQLLMYEDLLQMNTHGLILSSVGHKVLTNIAYDFLSLLETSTAVYEKNGDYALGIISSGWCRMLNQASRKLCETSDNETARFSGKWHCHESCWKNSSRKVIETGTSTDIECKGGIRIFSIPVTVNEEVIGAISFGYGNPPNNIEKLREISDYYQLSVEQLIAESSKYESRPAYIIELAKERLYASANLIGEIVNRKITEKKLIDLNESLENLVTEKTSELKERIEELERFYEATISREFRIKELIEENEFLRKNRNS